MKDNFSAYSENYAKYRPAYPDEFFTYLKTIISGKENAWDCGTGTGQMAEKLALIFDNVYATDISQSQIDNAVKLKNIHYSVQPAEQTDFPDNFFDAIVVAQAIHWFDFDKFYTEVRRTAKDNALLAVVGYGRLKISEEIDQTIDNFYFNILGSYWDKERKYIDEDYLTIPFPFDEINASKFENSYEWRLEHLIGYLTTWSAVRHYINEKEINPVDQIADELKEKWGEHKSRVVSFPVLLRIGKIRKTKG